MLYGRGSLPLRARARSSRGASSSWGTSHIPPGREGLFVLVRALPDTLRYETQFVIAEGDYHLMLYGRCAGRGAPAASVVADVVRVEDGKLAEHWDVWEEEATPPESVSGGPMFGDRFPAE
ncbi:hypothetical protein AB0N16_00980 [Streptomyces sp. NPDC051105]|uniref:nuclear transport factor 2 family protein n=1 Tax=Streptomyces sp. NPDC051105 TaxID=3154843 RepID=UPI0034378062